MDQNMFTEYCTGCGLCHSEANIEFKEDAYGYMEPILSQEDIEFCSNVCPASGISTKYMDKGCIWGNFITAYKGWANNKEIRKNASSGGVLTSICCYLIENNIVDGIIQTKVSDKVPFETQTVISRTCDEIKECAGSRYSVSMPLYDLSRIMKEDEKYAIVAKPCDISALRMYMKKNKELEKKIKYLFSFFCAGMPSKNAQLKLLKELGCDSIDECSSLRYRGNGWPGYATLINSNGIEKKMSYEKSWGTILGREVRKCCRFCFDGVGEFADIACGDLWYLTSDNKPDFREAEGRNIIFARSEVGEQLIKEIAENDRIYIENTDITSLKYVQQYQYDRKAFMKSMILGLKIYGKKYPLYEKNIMNSFSKLKPLKKVVRRTFGIMKRIKQGKI